MTEYSNLALILSCLCHIKVLKSLRVFAWAGHKWVCSLALSRWIMLLLPRKRRCLEGSLMYAISLYSTLMEPFQILDAGIRDADELSLAVLHCMILWHWLSSAHTFVPSNLSTCWLLLHYFGLWVKSISQIRSHFKWAASELSTAWGGGMRTRRRTRKGREATEKLPKLFPVSQQQRATMSERGKK